LLIYNGRVEDASGNPLDRVAVRFTSTDLNSYDDIGHRTVEEVVTSSDGEFIGRLLAGIYTVELIPEAADQSREEQSPLRLEDVVVRGGALTLPTQRLEKLFPYSGRMVDPLGEGVPDALLSCTELGFDRRTWSTRADDAGFFELRISRNEVRCVLTPSGARLDLPVTARDLEPVGHDGRLGFAQGVPVRGSVLLDGRPEPFALLEFTDDDGIRFGSVLTGSEGTFELRLAIP
jgi:hypothetical protein